jgi:hypothetical protein
MGLLQRNDPSVRVQAEQIARESEGSPYLLSELAHAVRAGIQRPGGRTTRGVTDPAPPDGVRIQLDEALWRRIERLPQSARDLLEILSVASRPLRVGDALRAAQATDANAALSRLRNDRLVRATGAGADELLAPYHDRIRETCTARLPKDRLRALHRTLVGALSARMGADSQVLAIHHEGAGDWDAAGRYYASAADEAGGALAFEQAASLYRKSLAVRPSSGAERGALLVRLADALANAGLGIDAAQQYLAASALVGPDETLMLRSKAGFNYCAAGDIDAARTALAGVLDELGTPLPRTRTRALVSLMWGKARLRLRGIAFRERAESTLSADERRRLDVTWSVACGLTLIDTIRGADFQTRNLLLALKIGEPYRIARALAWEATHLAMEGVGSRQRALRFLEAADQIAARLDNAHAAGMAVMSRGVAAFFLGDLNEAAAVCDRAAVLFTERCTGAAWELDTCHAFAFWARFLSGRLSELREEFPRLVTEAQRRGDRLAEANFTTYGGPFVFLARDRPDEAATALADVMGQWSQQDFHVQHFTTLSAHAFVNLYREDGLAAWSQLERQWKALEASFLLQVEIVRIYLIAQRANCALAAADALARGATVANTRWTVPALEREAARAASRLERERADYAKPLAQIVRAALDARAGREGAAIRLLEQAVATLDALQLRLVAAAARYQLGALRGDAAGREHMALAEQWMSTQGIDRPERIASIFAAGFRRPASHTHI